MGDANKLWLPNGVDLAGYVQTVPAEQVVSSNEELEAEVDQLLESLGANSGRQLVDETTAKNKQRSIADDLFESSSRDGISPPNALAIRRHLISSHVPSYRELLRQLAEYVEMDLKLIGCTLPAPIAIAEVYRGEFNAEVRRLHSGYAILINVGLLLSIHQATKIFVWSWNFRDLTTGKEVSPAWSNEQTTMALAELASAAIQSSVDQAPQYPIPSSDRLEWLARMTDGGERFAIAHEFAHIVGGDVDQERDDNQDQVWRTKRTEFTADAVALQIVLASENWSGRIVGGRYHLRLVCWGIVTCFFTKHLFETVGRVVFGHAIKTVYPAPRERVTRLITVLERKLDQELIDQVLDSVTWWEAQIEAVMNDVDWRKEG